MQQIALTGNIGSGKTTVAMIFKASGIPIYNSDNEAKCLIASDLELQKALCRKFTSKLFNNNKIDKQAFANIIFSDSNNLKIANSIIHPKVFEHFREWQKSYDSPYVIMESAIIYENNLQHNFSKVINVHANKDVRLQRLLKKMDVDEINKRMSAQINDNEKKELADFNIINDNTLLIEQVIKTHNSIING